jgi:hypothetical protein
MATEAKNDPVPESARYYERQAKDLSNTAEYRRFAMQEAFNHVVNALYAQAEEITRLKRGEFTPEEFQALCHHRDERPGCTRADFEAGCDEYQRKLFGPAAGV